MNVTIPKGKGTYLWQIKTCLEKFDLTIEQLAHAIAEDWGFDHVSIKIQDGRWAYTQMAYWQHPNQQDYLEALVPLLQGLGVEVWGWGYLRGSWMGWTSPEAEAARAVELVKKYNLAGYHIDAEHEYRGQYSNATRFVNKVNELDGALDIALGLSSYRWPTCHPDFPFTQFLSRCTHHYPQLYWQSAHNPRAQLLQSISELKAKRDLPVVPVGACYSEHGWTPQPAEIEEFIAACHELELPGLSWWSLQHMADHPELFEIIQADTWQDPSPPPPTVYPPIEDGYPILVDDARARGVEI